MTFRREWLKVYFIFGDAYSEHDSLPIIEQALASGVTMFQLREKGPFAKEGQSLVDYGLRVKKICDYYNVPFVVNDDVDLAITLEADGVHLGQDDLSIDAARKLLPSHMFVGISATNLLEALEAKEQGADYIGLGPVYQTSTKKDAKKPIGLKQLAVIKQQLGDTPTVAIGGLLARDMPYLQAEKVDGAAVISAISERKDIQTAVSEFLIRGD